VRRTAPALHGGTHWHNRPQITAQIASGEGRILERQIAASNLEEERRAEAETDLRETDGKLAELVQQAIAARDQLKHIDIRASQDGIVHELAYHTVGGVIPPGETIAIIVPVADEDYGKNEK